MLSQKVTSKRDNHIKKLIADNLTLAQMEVSEVNEDDLSVTLKYGENKYYTDCSLRGLNTETTDDDIYSVEIPELNSKVWGFLVWNNQVIIVKVFRPKKVITKANNTTITVIDKNIEVKCKDIQITIDGETNNISINTDTGKLYLNTEDESEPLLRGETTKTHLEKLYDYVDDIYTKFLAHTHTGNMGSPTPLNPPETVSIPIKQGELASDKATTSQTLSTKNFTE